MLFDIVLRNFNPFFGNTTALQQAIQLEPEITLMWLGNNDILGSVMAGGDPELITGIDDFRSEFTLVLSELQNKTSAEIFMANISGYLPIAFAFDGIFQFIEGFSPDKIPVLFDCETFIPINFAEQGELYIPLLIEKVYVKFLLLTAFIDYLEEDMGIPDEQDFIDMGFTDTDALISAMEVAGLNTEGDSVDIPLVDINSIWDPEKEGAFGGYSGEFVLDDPVNTTFSLDGIHPNNLGHAIIANA